jgi:hypothetical protein
MDIRPPAALRPFILAGVMLIAASAAAITAHAQGTDEERRACTPDVMRLCREHVPNVSAIVQCLVDKRPELSPECKMVMRPPEPEPVRTTAAPARKRVSARQPVERQPAARQPAARQEAARQEAVEQTADTPWLGPTERAAATQRGATAARPKKPARRTASAQTGAAVKPPMNIVPTGAKPKKRTSAATQSAVAGKPKKTTATP